MRAPRASPAPRVFQSRRCRASPPCPSRPLAVSRSRPPPQECCAAVAAATDHRIERAVAVRSVVSIETRAPVSSLASMHTRFLASAVIAVVAALLTAPFAAAQQSLDRFNRQLEQIRRDTDARALSDVPANQRALI